MLNDIRYAVRMLRKAPGFTLVAISSLAIGIGANSAIYSFADAVMLRPLPVLQPSRVVNVTAETTGMFGAYTSMSYPDYQDLRDRNRTFDGLLASSYASFGFARDDRAAPRMKFGAIVSGNFFQVLGVEPDLGRGFRAEEDRVAGRDAVAVLSHGLWVSEFGSKRSVLGQGIWLNGMKFTIVGVAPERFTGLEQIKPALYVPLAMSPALAGKNNLTQRGERWLGVKGRLKPGVSVNEATADVSTIAAALRKAYPKEDETLRLKAQSEFQMRVERSPPDTALLLMLGLLALTVLLVACANVAGLLLSRSSVRAREIAVRLALGGSRASLVRQLLVENLLLSLAGALAGLGIALAAVKFFNTLPIPTEIPVDLSVRLNERVLLFTLAVAVASTFLFGLTPALHGTRLDLTSALKERASTGARRSLWGRNLIVAGQVALSLILLIVSAVLVDGFRSQLSRGPGFRIDALQLMTFDTGLVHYAPAQSETFYRQLLEKVEQAGEVQSAAISSSIPLSMTAQNAIDVIPEGHHFKRGEHTVNTFDSVVSPAYFRTLAIPIVQGRGFLASDRANAAPVAIVNEAFARHYWPNQNALGKRIWLKDASSRPLEIVGVAKSSKYLWISESPLDFVYLPFLQNQAGVMSLIVQSRSTQPADLVPTLKQIVQSIDRSMPGFEIRTMRSLYENRAVKTPNIITETVAAMGVLGLLLAVIGLYGVVSYSVSQRAREFGIRMAVGASRRNVTEMVLRQGLVLGIAGLAVGLLVSVFVVRGITATMLFAFPVGALPFAGVGAVLLAAMLLAAYAPARRAARLDPMRALREE